MIIEYGKNRSQFCYYIQFRCVNRYHLNSLLLFSIDSKLQNQVGEKRENEENK
jgi:hypothetical protein